MFQVGQKDTLFLSVREENYPTFGITGLLNIGDVNNEKGDELAIIMGWADCSLVTRCEIWTCKNQEWNKMKDFLIHEEQIFDDTSGNVVLIRYERENRSLSSKGIFYLGKVNVYYYEYDGIDGRIIEKSLKGN